VDATAQWEHFVARRMAGPVPYIYSAHRIERVDPPPGPPQGGPIEGERAMLHYRASFGPDPALPVAHRPLPSALSFATDYSVGSAIPLHAYADWLGAEDPPDKEPLGRFPRLDGAGFRPYHEWPQPTSRATRVRAAKRQANGFTVDEMTIRNTIRRHYLPAAPDVLGCLVRDVEGLTGLYSFEDWAEEFCLEPPQGRGFAKWLRHWRRAYDQLITIAPAVRNMFGEQWDEACELVREL